MNMFAITRNCERYRLYGARVCGKTPELSNLDLLIHTLKGISEIVVKGDLNVRFGTSTTIC